MRFLITALAFTLILHSCTSSCDLPDDGLYDSVDGEITVRFEGNDITFFVGGSGLIIDQCFIRTRDCENDLYKHDCDTFPSPLLITFEAEAVRINNMLYLKRM